MSAPVLSVQGLTTTFTGRDPFEALTDICFEVRGGEVFAILGESGCGKSVTALSIVRLAGPTARVDGEVRLGNADLLSLDESGMRGIRGARIAMVMQNPFSALNPAIRVGDQIAEAIRAHASAEDAALFGRRSLLRRERRNGEVWRRVVRLLEQVGISDAADAATRWPHEFSGGMCQRVVTAIALACEPELLIADEPTTALDVTVQREIIALLDRIRHERDTGILLISHDFALIGEFADRAAVLYAGQIMEMATVDDLMRNPLHPYTSLLLECVPDLGHEHELATIPGTVPHRYDRIAGCRFHDRCPKAVDACRTESQDLRELEKGHFVRCHLATT
ncbi:MAG TPA: ABC transporter ATP-binding protein [Armatimonadota bacterium]|nr:ABC transporter ATP-binding protein [Armatimonadota bacterium]